MAKVNKVLAIDIGAENLKMAEFEESSAGLTMTGFAIRKFELEEGADLTDVFSDYYNSMIAENNFKAKYVRLSLSAQNSFQRLSKLPPILGAKETVSRLVEFEASQTVPCSMDEVEWDYQLQHHTWEETIEEEQEDGTIVETVVPREEYEALFVALRTEDVVCFTDVIEASGKVLLTVDVAPVALFNAALMSQIKADECTLVLNIGATSSSLMISDNRRVFLRNIPIGGDSITAQIAREFSIKVKEADDFKRRYGFIALGGAYEDPESELVATISKLARNVMTRLHGEVSRSISVWRAQHGGSAPAKVLLSGGGSTLRYTTDFFHEKLRLPVEYLNAYTLINIGAGVNKELLQSVAIGCQELIGVALHARGRCPVAMNLLPKVIKSQMMLDTKKPFFYASAVTLIACLTIFITMVGNYLEQEEQKLEKSKHVLQVAKRRKADIDGALGELNGAKNQFVNAKSVADKRTIWADEINKIQQVIPEDTWLTKIEYWDQMRIEADDAASMVESSGGTSASSAAKDISVAEAVKLGEIKRIVITGYMKGPKSEVDNRWSKLRADINNLEANNRFQVRMDKSQSNTQVEDVDQVFSFKLVIDLATGIAM